MFCDLAVVLFIKLVFFSFLQPSLNINLMPKILQKYFIAIVPEGELQEQVTGLKFQLKEQFNLKYALKSPAHVTLKMPFLWNQAKEVNLVTQLGTFFQEQAPFELKLSGIGKFGNRVIYIKVREQKELITLQSKVSMLCKSQLKLNQELSDQAYHPHMTLAFKDIKKAHFIEYFNFIKDIGFNQTMEVKQVALLKKVEHKWKVAGQFFLAKK